MRSFKWISALGLSSLVQLASGHGSCFGGEYYCTCHRECHTGNVCDSVNTVVNYIRDNAPDCLNTTGTIVNDTLNQANVSALAECIGQSVTNALDFLHASCTSPGQMNKPNLLTTTAIVGTCCYLMWSAYGSSSAPEVITPEATNTDEAHFDKSIRLNS